MGISPVSKPTGKYWPCNFNATHHPRPVVLPIKKGPQRFFLSLCICGGNGRAALMPQDWTPEMGLTYEQAEKQGYIVLAIARAQ